jgi:hypothetical protein
MHGIFSPHRNRQRIKKARSDRECLLSRFCFPLVKLAATCTLRGLRQC